MTSVPQMMTGIKITEKGGPEVLQPAQMPTPVPGAGQVLVKVAAAGVNRPDVQQRMGAYPPPPGHSQLPGLEIAGVVVSASDATSRYKPGDAVCALTNGGGYAEYCLAEETATLPVPGGLDMIHAAAVPETYFTVWHNIFERGALRPGEWLLVHGGTSGIGTTAIQLAVAMGSRVIATAGSDEKCDVCRQLGAECAVNYKTQDFIEAVKRTTGGKGANVILDMVGGTYVDRNIVAAAEDGRIVQIATLEAPMVQINVARLMMKRLTLTGSTLRPRTREVKAGLARALEQKVWPLLGSGELKVIIDSTYPLAQADQAHRRMETSQHVGKIVLTC